MPLDRAGILAGLAGAERRRVRRCEVAWTIGSTNDELLAADDLPPGRCDVLLAEYQRAGRGRRARRWLAPPGGALCLSISWAWESLPHAASALGLAAGVAARRALGDFGVPTLPQLKWPNDLVVDGRKLGGILIELRAEAGGPAHLVIGVGLNVALGAGLRKSIAATGTSATDLRTLGCAHCDRNALAARLIARFIEAFVTIERTGFEPFAADWRAADALRGRPVAVESPRERVRGVAAGIDRDGALLVRTGRATRRFVSGDVSVRSR